MDLGISEVSRQSACARSRRYGADAGFAQVLDRCADGPRTRYDDAFQAAADAYQIPVGLLKAVAKAESAFTHDAVSPCGAVGVMQLMPGTARALGVADPYDPAQNIMGGAKYLRQMLDRFNGDPALALAAYNAGPGAVERYGAVPPYPETQSYVARVLSGAGLSGQDTLPAAVPGGQAPAGLDGADPALLARMLQQMLFSRGGVSPLALGMLLARPADPAGEAPITTLFEP